MEKRALAIDHLVAGSMIRSGLEERRPKSESRTRYESLVFSFRMRLLMQRHKNNSIDPLRSQDNNTGELALAGTHVQCVQSWTLFGDLWTEIDPVVDRLYIPPSLVFAHQNYFFLLTLSLARTIFSQNLPAETRFLCLSFGAVLIPPRASRSLASSTFLSHIFCLPSLPFYGFNLSFTILWCFSLRGD
jgi:hypothetical protein